MWIILYIIILSNMTVGEARAIYAVVLLSAIGYLLGALLPWLIKLLFSRNLDTHP